MQLSDLFEKYPRPDKLPRVAELAALILSRSVAVEPMSAEDAANYADGFAKACFVSMSPGHAAYVADLLVKRAEQLHKLAEHDCNFGLSEAQEKRKERLQEQVREIAEAVGFRVETGGDPRGAVVRLFDPKDERSGDGWGGGWPVYR